MNNFLRLSLRMLVAISCLAGSCDLIAQDKSADNSGQALQGDEVEGEMLHDDKPRVVSGTIVNLAKEPLAECLMIAEVRHTDGSSHRISAHTDANGHFTLTFPGDAHSLQRYDTWCYKEGYGLRAVSFGFKLLSRHKFNDAVIVLLPSDEVSVRILDPNDKPLVNVQLEPTGYCMPGGTFSADNDQVNYGNPPAEIAELLRVRTDASGFGKLEGTSAQFMGRIKATSEPYGSQIFPCGNRRELIGRLMPVGSVEGRVITTDPAQFTGSKLRIHVRLKQRSNRVLPEAAEVEVVLDDQAQFHVPSMAAGKADIEVLEWPAKKIVLPVLAADQTIRANSKNEININLVRSIELTGRILRQDDKRPVSGAKVSVANSFIRFRDMDVTDNNGIYQLYVAPGMNRVGVFPLPNDVVYRYDYPKSQSVLLDPLKDTVDVPNIQLVRAPVLTVHLLDAGDQPIMHAKVLTGYVQETRVIEVRARISDAEGKFEIPLHLPRPNENSIDPFGMFLASEVDEDAIDPNQALKVIRMTEKELWLRK